ncbi:MAG: hypothetical protein ACTTKU_07260 [Eggerthia catenaformis]|uniref:hypothetical protein n=1 Tax=Eggerthia catenaformis TaxID=31973 RepID=UPI003FA01F83
MKRLKNISILLMLISIWFNTMAYQEKTVAVTLFSDLCFLVGSIGLLLVIIKDK